MASAGEEKKDRHDIMSRLKHGRTISQVFFLAATAWVAYRMLSGALGATVEKYCPFGGVETLIPWLNKTGTLCSLSTMNISILAGLLLITLLYKRAFCSHICPVGALSEWISAFGRRYIIKSKRIPRSLDRLLVWLKYVVLVLIVWGTVRIGELIFREADPYYVLFTLGRGHGIADGVMGIGAYSLAIVLFLFALSAVIPLAFCRYLCPLAACLNPFSKFGLVRVHRNKETCIDCEKCDRACKWGVVVSAKASVTSAECSNCQDCLRSCPVPETLSLRIGRSKT